MAGDSEADEARYGPLDDLETTGALNLAGIWMDACDACGAIGRSKSRRARAYWIGLGSREEVMRSGLIAYRDAATDAAKEAALLNIIEQYDADVAAESKR